MINRKMLYGYQIRNGALEIVPEEQRTVSMVFTLYNAGASYQAISDALNRQSIPYCREVPLWNKHKVKRLLENPRYTGKEGYPILVEADIFQAAQEKTAEKNARKQSHGEKPAIARLTPYFRCTCGGKMTRLGGGWQNSGKLYLRCEGCGNTAVMDMDATVNGIVRQFRDHEQTSCTAYTPSAEVMRLDNAINRGLEQPDSPEAVMALILQGAAARYEVLSGYLRGFEISLPPAVLTMLGVCGVRLSWLRWVFPQYKTFMNIMLVFPISLATTALLMLAAVLYFRPSRRYAHLQKSDGAASAKIEG